MQQVGQKLTQWYFDNYGGLNLADSFFKVQDGQALGGFNYEYVRTGGIQKSLCPARLNSVANAQLRTLGLFLRNTKTNVKSIIRAAGTKIQLTDLSGTFTDLTEDTSAVNSNFLASGTTLPVVGSMFTSSDSDILWLAGGGMTSLYGVASTSKVTSNGVVAPTGTLAPNVVSGTSSFVTTGTYRYTFAYRKASTQALSNAGVEAAATIGNVTEAVQLPFSGLTNLDTTKYDQIYIYRSAVGGAVGFTTGDLIAQVASTATSYTDTGTSIASATNIPRSGSTVDNSALPTGTYETIARFKRRLVTAKDSTVYFSDLNKSESWPAGNFITIPSGGKITGLAVINFNTQTTTSTDEFLAIFKETELWVITGSSIADWSLQFVDFAGSANQSLIVESSGYLYFIDARGVYIWDGAGKPMYVSRPIEDLFGINGKLDKTKLNQGSGVFFRRQNEVVWFLSNTDLGDQKYILKLDLRQTLPRVASTLSQRIMDGVFLQGKLHNSVYAASSFIFPTSSSQEDVLVTGDDAGYCYRQFYTSTGVGANDYSFSYETKYFDLGRPRVNKNYEQVVVWVDGIGDWNLTLDYWTDFKTSDDEKNSVSQIINPNTSGTFAVWDIGKWDQALWDGYTSKPRPVVFNLSGAPYNNKQGEVIKLRFKNENSDEPITIYGFGVVYSELNLRQ